MRHSRVTLRLDRVATAALLVGAACSPASRTAVVVPAADSSKPALARSPVAVAVPAPSAEDSAADVAALQALRELEFGSLAKGAGHVHGVVSAATPSGLGYGLEGALRRSAGPRGGAASATAPPYGLDVESFAGHNRVQDYVDYFLGPTRERFTIWLGRLPRYEGMIRARFRALGVPEDLVYLALIESGYSNTAVSRKRAVGMWQFISRTARRYGLTVNSWVDERRDPFEATDAAARLLADLNAQFGSWYLAAAAYNGGPGRVTRGIRRLSGRVDSLTDSTFFRLSERRYLRRETRDYVPKLIAAALIARDPLRYGFDSIPYVQPLVFDEITVPDATGLDVLAQLADTTPRALVELNPHYVRGVTPPGRPSIVRVPRGTGTMVARRFAELPPHERVNFIEHVVRRGQTLSEIGQRYRVSVRLLRAANGNVHPRRLRIGRRLIVPVSPAARSSVSRSRRAPRAMIRGAPGTTHVVRRGETLWIISQRYGIRVADLRRWNGIAPNDVLLRVGQRLVVRAPANESP